MGETVGFIGLGAMGRAMALNLLDRGHAIVGYDIAPAATRMLGARGGRIAASPADLARATDRIVCMVATTAQTEDVLLGPGGVSGAAREGTIVLLMNTIDPCVVPRLHTALADRGIVLLDAPVSGGVARAAVGELTVMLAGAAEAIAAAAPLLGAIGRQTFRIGAPGQAMAMKMVNNMLAQVNLVAVCEAVVMGVKAGLDPQLMFDVVRSGTGTSAMFENRMPRLIGRDFAPTGSVEIAFKDQELQTAFAKQVGAPALLASVSQQVYQMARVQGMGGEDAGAVLKVIERLAGISGED